MEINGKRLTRLNGLEAPMVLRDVPSMLSAKKGFLGVVNGQYAVVGAPIVSVLSVNGEKANSEGFESELPSQPPSSTPASSLPSIVVDPSKGNDSSKVNGGGGCGNKSS